MKTERWKQIEITLPAPSVDLVCAELADLGCVGTLVAKNTLDTFEVPDEEFDPNSDLKVQAYFPHQDSPQDLTARIETRLDELRPLFAGRQFILGEEQNIGQEDWADGWKQHFNLFRVGKRLIIKPSWEDYRAANGEKVLELDPGMAFGTGTHGTTLLCLEGIVALFDELPTPRTMLDVGTGSGILAMAAAALGAEDVLACDIDPLACQVASENCRLNGLSDKVRITTSPLEDLPGRYDIVVANILAEENLRLSEHLLHRLNPGGSLFLSGILAEKEALVRSGFCTPGLDLIDTTRQDEWVCLSYRKH